MTYLSIKNLVITFLITFLMGVVFFIEKPSTTIQDCWNTGFGWSKMYTPREKQIDCALITLKNAERVEIALKDIETLTQGNLEDSGAYKSSPMTTTLKECLDNALDNATASGCLYDVEESLQRQIRSIILEKIEKEPTKRDYWQNWYVNSIKKKKCNLDTSNTGSSENQVISMCYIRHNANEILWLLNQ